MDSHRRTLGSPAPTADAVPEPRSLVADLSPDALNRLLRIYAGVIAAGVAATGAVAAVVGA